MNDGFDEYRVRSNFGLRTFCRKILCGINYDGCVILIMFGDMNKVLSAQ